MTASEILPRWHSSGPQLVGRLKTAPEDFIVEEIPAYEPSGDGEHLFLWIEKRDVAAEQLLKHVGRVLGMPAHEIGSAGMKDRRAVARQWLSIPAKLAEHVPALETEFIRVLRAERHGNKLRTGHLRGNRFTITVRNVRPENSLTRDPAAAAEHLAERVRSRGFPNYFGDQRFGRDRDTLTLGLDLIAGRQTPKDIPYSRRKFLLKLSLSAVQSDLFNRCLANRLQDGLLDTVLVGDVMEVVATGGKFNAEDPVVEQPRCDACETVITGPMFGIKMRSATDEPAAREAAVLAAAGLALDSFRGFGDLLNGTRRPYVIRPSDLAVDAVEGDLRFQFTLPAGVYATTCLREWGDFVESRDEQSHDSVDAQPVEQDP